MATIKKLTLTAIGILGALFVVLLMLARGSAGVAKDMSQLRKVYANAGVEMAAFYTNTILQSLRFTSPIAWKRHTFRGSSVELRGQVDTNSWSQFLASNPSVASNAFYGTDYQLHYGYGHRVGNWLVITRLSIDVDSGNCEVRSHVGERSYDFYKIQFHQ